VKTGEETGGKHAAFDYRNTATSLVHNGCAAALLKLGNARLHLRALQLQAAHRLLVTDWPPNGTPATAAHLNIRICVLLLRRSVEPWLSDQTETPRSSSATEALAATEAPPQRELHGGLIGNPAEIDANNPRLGNMTAF